MGFGFLADCFGAKEVTAERNPEEKVRKIKGKKVKNPTACFAREKGGGTEHQSL